MANYTRKDPRSIRIFNTARVSNINGEVKSTNLRGIIKGNGKLAVGPGFIPSFLYGPYWVVKTGTKQFVASNQNQRRIYDWAIVSGGEPIKESNGKCIADKTGPFNLFGNNQGLWIFTRDQVVTRSFLEELKLEVSKLGLDVSALSTVQQVGCTWNHI